MDRCEAIDLQRALRAIPATWALAWVLRVKGHTLRDVSQRLGVSVGAASASLENADVMLRALLSGRPGARRLWRLDSQRLKKRQVSAAQEDKGIQESFRSCVRKLQSPSLFRWDRVFAKREECRLAGGVNLHFLRHRKQAVRWAANLDRVDVLPVGLWRDVQHDLLLDHIDQAKGIQ